MSLDRLATIINDGVSDCASELATVVKIIKNSDDFRVPMPVFFMMSRSVH